LQISQYDLITGSTTTEMYRMHGARWHSCGIERTVEPGNATSHLARAVKASFSF
jgi:hypothetical protein